MSLRSLQGLDFTYSSQVNLDWDYSCWLNAEWAKLRLYFQHQSDSSPIKSHYDISIGTWLTVNRIIMFVIYRISLLSWSGKAVCITGALWGETTNHWWFPSQIAINTVLWLFIWHGPEPSVEQRVELQVIWDTMMPVWCHSNVCDCTSVICHGVVITGSQHLDLKISYEL